MASCLKYNGSWVSLAFFLYTFYLSQFSEHLREDNLDPQETFVFVYHKKMFLFDVSFYYEEPFIDKLLEAKHFYNNYCWMLIIKMLPANLSSHTHIYIYIYYTYTTSTIPQGALQLFAYSVTPYNESPVNIRCGIMTPRSLLSAK